MIHRIAIGSSMIRPSLPCLPLLHSLGILKLLSILDLILVNTAVEIAHTLENASYVWAKTSPKLITLRYLSYEV